MRNGSGRCGPASALAERAAVTRRFTLTNDAQGCAFAKTMRAQVRACKGNRMNAEKAQCNGHSRPPPAAATWHRLRAALVWRTIVYGSNLHARIFSPVRWNILFSEN